MTIFLTRMTLSILLLSCLGVSVVFGSDGLIPPTRSLDRPRDQGGRLTVVSEPPHLEVFLDGFKIGHTPVWLKEVKPGAHKLRVRHSEADVYVERGKTLTLSFFKGSFLAVPEETEADKERAPEPGKLTEGRKVVKPRGVPTSRKSVRELLSPWVFSP